MTTDAAGALLRDAKHVVVFTGAGVSAESGVPTFRSDANALWREVDVRNFAYPDGYRRNQPDAWRWYAPSRATCSSRWGRRISSDRRRKCRGMP